MDFRKFYILFFSFIAVFNYSYSQINIVNGNGTVNILSNTSIIVEGNIELNNNGNIVNNGKLYIENNWINNSTSTSLSGNGKVLLYGVNQLIDGSSSTNFYNLELSGSGVKSTNIDTYVNDSLILNNLELFTDDNKLIITNSNAGIITRTTGYLSSLDTGCLVRYTNSTDTYIFPVGSNIGTFRYRPVSIKPTNSSANSYSVRFANTDATNENFDITNTESVISNINSQWYHRINRITGTSSADISITKDASENFEAMAHWNTQWVDMSIVNSSPTSVTKLAWNNFDSTAFVLSNTKIVIQASNDTNICYNSGVQLNVSVIDGVGPYAYYWTPSTYLDNANIANPMANNVVSDITYTVSVFDSASMSFSTADTVVISVNPVYSENISALICEGETYTFGTQILTTQGVYTEIFTSSTTCDSTVTLDLTVNPIYSENISASICEGET